MDAAQHRQSPYQGLIPYTEGDADFFFGRENDTRLITANLFAAPLTLLYGVSGVGKSSVLRAGVVHRIRERGDIVAVTFADWEKAPLEGLKAAVAEALTPRLSGAAVTSGVELPGLEEPLSSFLGTWAKLVGCRVAIILDQFEDYFQYHPEKSRFALEFSSAVMQSEAPISFLISIREDTYASLDRFESILPIIFDNYLRLDPLDRKAAQAAIEKPIERYNERCMTGQKPYSVEPRLVEAVLEDVQLGKLALGAARGSQKKIEPKIYQVDTPYLQLVMTRLWKEEVKGESRVLRRGTLDRLGGALKIVRMHLEGVMGELSPEEKRIAALVFRYLVTPKGTKVAYPVDELAKYERVDKDHLASVLKKLSEGDKRILRQVSPLPGLWAESRYEIFHDALGPAILDWGVRYIREQEQEEANRKMEARRAQAHKELEWKTRWIKRLMGAVGLLFVVSILLAIATYYAYKHRNAAEAATAKIEQQKNEIAKQKSQLEKTLELVGQQDLEVKYTKKVMRGHRGAVTDAAFSPDNRWIITGSDDGTAIIWDVNTGTLAVGEMQGHSGAIHDVAVSPNGRLVATASEDHTVCLWDASNGNRVSTLAEHKGPVLSVDFSRDGTYLLTASADGTARVWGMNQANSMYTLSGHGDAISEAEFSPDGKLILTASADRTARIWDAATGQEKHVLRGHMEVVNSARFSEDGNSVVTASRDNTARTWDADSGALKYVLVGHAGSVNYAEFSPDGERLVTASSDNTARIWQASNGREYAELSGHNNKVNIARFSSDGKRVITASDDKTARTWNAQSSSKNFLVELRGHLAKLNNAVFSLDNNTLLTASEDKTARIWDVSQFGGFRISQASIEAVNYQGPCPTTIRVDAKIEVAEGSGVIQYRIVRSDRGATQTFKRMIDGTGPAFVTYLLGVPKGTPPSSGKISIEVIEPNPVPSAPVSLRIRCLAVTESTPSPTPSPSP
jgi:WD40 repeat protein